MALIDCLRDALAELKQRPGQLALLFIDLDDFKSVNDTRGHSTGDTVLREVGRRLARVSRDSDTVARLGGDEFVLMVPGFRQGDDLDLLCDRVMRAIWRSPVGRAT